MTTAPDPHPHDTPARSASASLLAAATASTSDEMSIGELLDALEDRAFGMALLLFALPCCLPFVYGLPQVVSVPMLLISLQLVAGRHTLWLPEGVKRRTFSRAAFTDVATRSQKYLRWFEALARPRLSFLTRNGPERIFGLALAVFCVSIAIPLPATNTVPGIAVAIMSIGFIERDGVLVIAGTILGAVWVTLLAIFGAVIVTWISAAGQAALSWLMSLF